MTRSKHSKRHELENIWIKLNWNQIGIAWIHILNLRESTLFVKKGISIFYCTIFLTRSLWRITNNNVQSNKWKRAEMREKNIFSFSLWQPVGRFSFESERKKIEIAHRARGMKFSAYSFVKYVELQKQ